MFIDNVNNYPLINHKDENPSNNNVENLEWCTHEYNMNYGNINKKRKTKKQGVKFNTEHKNNISKSRSISVIGVNITNNTIIFFKSAKECGENGFNSSIVTQCCLINLLGLEEYLKERKYPRKTSIHRGYDWFYKDDYEKRFVR